MCCLCGELWNQAGPFRMPSNTDHERTQVRNSDPVKNESAAHPHCLLFDSRLFSNYYVRVRRATHARSPPRQGGDEDSSQALSRKELLRPYRLFEALNQDRTQEWCEYISAS